MMKFKSPPPHRVGLRFKPHERFMLSVVFAACLPFVSLSQCQAPDPSPEAFAAMQAAVPLIQQYAQTAQQRSEAIRVPVYYHVLHNSAGGGASVSNADADAGISALNSTFGGAGLEFYRLGNVNNLDFNGFSSEPLLWIPERYSYVTSALNVYVGAPSSAPQPDQTAISPFHRSNVVKVGTLGNSAGGLGSYNVQAHETGHTLGLLHTFNAPQVYIYPPTAFQIDHPETGTYKRELVIRQNTPGKNFDEPNCHQAADLCCDTQADCYWDTNYFPAFIPNANGGLNCATSICQPGCSVTCGNFNIQYKDYNLDIAPGEKYNIMSYHDCGNQVSDDQKDRIRYYYNTYWANQYKETAINVQSNVLFMNKSPMNKVWVQWHHNTGSDYCNSFTDNNGKLQGALYQPTVFATVRKLGSGVDSNSTPPIPGILGSSVKYKFDTYTDADWSEGITTCDVIKIRRFVLDIENLNGWQQLAGDVNRDERVSTLDGAIITKMILGIIKTFPPYQAPWRFAPRFIAENEPVQWDISPFNMSATGPGTVYTDPNFTYNSALAQRGYGGVHLGDVGDCQLNLCESTPELDLPATILAPGKRYLINIKSNDFDQVYGFQLGLQIDHELMEVKDVRSENLTAFNKEAYANLNELQNNALRVLWYKDDATAQSLSKGNTLLSFEVETKQAVTNLSAAFKIDNSVLKNAFYQDEAACDTDLDLYASITDLGAVEGRSTNPTELTGLNPALICFPNPVSGELNIAFESAVAEKGEIRMVDVNGRIVRIMPVHIEKGVNTLRLSATDLEAVPAGILTVTLHSDTATKSARVSKQ